MPCGKAFGWFWLPIFIAFAIMALSGCSSVAPSTGCPTLARYDSEFQERLAKEVATLPPGAALDRAMVDYGALRAAVRACHE